MEFIELDKDDEASIREMSTMASEIVKEHYDPIIGEAQNDYMIRRFQSPEAIRKQLEEGAHYHFVAEEGTVIGFLSYYLRDDSLYLSKLYLYKVHRGRGHARGMVEFLADRARKAGLGSIELNVNRHNDAVKAYEALGFERLREERNDIGGGFVMDDYVYGLQVGDGSHVGIGLNTDDGSHVDDGFITDDGSQVGDGLNTDDGSHVGDA